MLRKKVIKSGIIALIVALILIFIILYLEFTFIINSDLSLHLSPSQKTLMMVQDSEEMVRFEVSIDRTSVCSTECNYNIKNLGDGTIVQQSTFRPNSSSYEISYIFKSPIIGKGQEIYAAEFTCRNIKSFFCRTSGKNITTNSLVTLNYDLSPERLNSSVDAKFLLESILSTISKADVMLQGNEYALSQLDGKILISLNLSADNYARLLSAKDIMLKSWNDENYAEINSEGPITLERTKEYLSLQQAALFTISRMTMLHNDAVVDMLAYADDSEQIIYRNNFYDMNFSNPYLQDFTNFNSLNFTSYDEFRSSIRNRSFENFNRQSLIIDSEFIRIGNSLLNISCPECDPAELSTLSDNMLSMEYFCENINFSSIFDYSNTSLINTSLVLSLQKLISDNITLVPRANLTLNFCMDRINLPEPDFIEIDMKEFPSRINVDIPEREELCCVFGECRKCCTDCRNTSYPVMFIHGHALNSDNSPQYSMSMFDSLRDSMQSDGYLNAGFILPDSWYSDIPESDWGRSGRPIIAAFSYYLDVYDDEGLTVNIVRNSEHISNYSDRLDAAVELLKYRTGKDKIILIAHSMGGLVAREYIRRYGDDSVDKLIMVGTPNLGVSGSTDTFCGVLGEKIECSEMSFNSTFLKRLNSFDFASTDTNYYTITGQCSNNPKTDGVVPVDRSILDYAKKYYVQGDCSAFNPLHNSMLDTKTYNSTYLYIKEILSE